MRIARISGGQNEEDPGLLLRSYPKQAGILFLTNMEPQILFQTPFKRTVAFTKLSLESLDSAACCC